MPSCTDGGDVVPTRDEVRLSLRVLNEVIGALADLSDRGATISFQPQSKSTTVHVQPHAPFTIANFNPAAALVSAVLRLRRLDSSGEKNGPGED